MPKTRPPHVTMYRDRHGRCRWRFRRKGFKETQTTLPFASDDWWRWYWAALDGTLSVPVRAGAGRSVPGSFNALIVELYGSAEWRALKPVTRETYRRRVEALREKFGHLPVAKLARRHVKLEIDSVAGQPGAANNLLRTFRQLMRFAIDREWRPDDPTRGIRALSTGSDGFHTWSEEEITRFEEAWPTGTKERLALDLLLYTAQRSSDVREMGPQHVRDGMLLVKQSKTGTRLEIPIHPRLAASLEATPVQHLTFLTTQYGRPFTAKGFGNWFSKAARRAGLPSGVSAHGLRKAAATRLANAGCSPHEIQAITGHRTLKEVERYTRAADQRSNAAAAFSKLAGTETEQALSNRSGKLDKLRSR